MDLYKKIAKIFGVVGMQPRAEAEKEGAYHYDEEVEETRMEKERKPDVLDEFTQALRASLEDLQETRRRVEEEEKRGANDAQVNDEDVPEAIVRVPPVAPEPTPSPKDNSLEEPMEEDAEEAASNNVSGDIQIEPAMDLKVPPADLVGEAPSSSGQLSGYGINVKDRRKSKEEPMEEDAEEAASNNVSGDIQIEPAMDLKVPPADPVGEAPSSSGQLSGHGIDLKDRKMRKRSTKRDWNVDDKKRRED